MSTLESRLKLLLRRGVQIKADEGERLMTAPAERGKMPEAISPPSTWPDSLRSLAAELTKRVIVGLAGGSRARRKAVHCRLHSQAEGDGRRIPRRRIRGRRGSSVCAARTGSRSSIHLGGSSMRNAPGRKSSSIISPREGTSSSPRSSCRLIGGSARGSCRGAGRVSVSGPASEQWAVD